MRKSAFLFWKLKPHIFKEPIRRLTDQLQERNCGNSSSSWFVEKKKCSSTVRDQVEQKIALRHKIILYRSRTRTNHVSYSPYYFCNAVAASTYGNEPCRSRNMWWIAASDCYDGWGFYEERSNYPHGLFFREANKFLTSFWLQDISLITLRHRHQCEEYQFYFHCR